MFKQVAKKRQKRRAVAMRSSVEVVARKVEADIKRRGLASGDRYMTGDEVGRMLNISSVTANRAMQLLAERGLLVRQRKAGTFIGENVDPPSTAVRKRVHIVLASGIWPDEQTATDHYLNQLLGGVLEVMPGISIQADIVGPQEINGFVRRIVDNYSATGEVAGVVLVRSTLEAQRQLVEAGVPSVVFGSVFPGIRGLACVDMDQRQVGQLSAQYLIQAKHQRVLALMLSQWSPGDNAFISGLIGEFQSAPQVQVELQSTPVDDEVCRGVVRSVLDREVRPTAIVARSPWLARVVAEVIQSVGLAMPDDVELILGNHHELEIDGRRIPRAEAVETMQECGRKLGRMLAVMGHQYATEVRQELVPVRFVT
jgi:biotin operon repressor